MFKSILAQALRCSSNAQLPHGQQVTNVTKVWVAPLPEVSKWIVPIQMHYIENGKLKIQDIVKVKDSVSVVLYNISRQKLIFVRQFRPAVYHGLIMGNTRNLHKEDIDLIRFPYELGITLESCAGVVDKDKSLAEIAKDEVFEECGYNVPVDKLEHVFEYRPSVGASSSAHNLYYCEVCDEEKVSDGGGIDNEVIQVVELSIDEARNFVKEGSSINSGPTTIAGTLWFLANKI
ncbi:uridine diphosphate glucose pyrophosphatase NUDT14-like [Drosophila hydei]|uniref:Uridine diphosphate glucose pyrophosphatase NUDT14 n=1 Tax=Drosophila hydei TaxID=7224 RepID=A0A6J1LYR8_DROHY|nr:uridine diphosphate glucose pyrophosphatase NUDT14-like [Drosophila hydei]